MCQIGMFDQELFDHVTVSKYMTDVKFLLYSNTLNYLTKWKLWIVLNLIIIIKKE